ncbi:MAG: hypothetical protein QF691_00180 [SAR324 cluster bacterium]|nr:hypothetical protein [SAR324 cluster bacterium]
MKMKPTSLKLEQAHFPELLRDIIPVQGKKVGLKFNLKQGPDFGSGPYSP